MAQQQDQTSTVSNPKTTSGTGAVEKALYFGAGLAIGVMISPKLKEITKQAMPQLTDLWENLIGKSESIIETSQDFYAKAKKEFKKEKKEKEHDHPHTHPHSHEGDI